MQCIRCGRKTQVKDSFQKRDGYRRRRQCPQGHKFNTIERLLPDRKKPQTHGLLIDDEFDDVDFDVTRLV